MRTAPRLLPDRGRLLDLALLLGLCVLALVGLTPTFTGPQFALVGCAGLLLGVGITQLGAALRWPAVGPVVLAVGVFFLLGGPLCLRSDGTAAYLPGPSTLTGLVDRVVHGWKDLLTTLPPVDGDGPLLVLPWLLGLVAGVTGVLLLGVRPRGARSRGAMVRVALPLAVPVGLLAVVVLLGVRHPQSLLLQGTAFAVLALAWLAVRARRLAAHAGPRGSRIRRSAAGAAVLGLAALLAVPLGNAVMGSDDGRVVLRTYVEPPFDIGRYPSPLASFRRYVEVPEPDGRVNLYDVPLFTVEGPPAGTRVRIATLDVYDGIVWGAGGDPVPGSAVDTFQRVSSTIDNPVPGRRVEARVTVEEGWSGVWLPTVGALRGLQFDGERAQMSEETFRYNLATSTAVVPSGVREGDRYSLVAALPDDEVSPDDAPSSAVGEVALAAGFLDTQADQWSAGQTEPMRRVFAVAEHLKREGRYSDGVRPDERVYHAGHHLKRLADEFVNYPIMVGNDEQYAAVMALLANRIGVPARVVMGAVLPGSGVVTGADVSAWVELQVADGSWRTLPTEAFMDFDRPAEQPPQDQREMSGVLVPPPAPVPPPSTAGEQTDTELQARKNPADDTDDAGGLPAWLRAVLLYVGGPLLLLAALLGSVVLLKAWRRRRRRRAGRTSAQVVGAWRELVDHARDLGRPVPVAGGVTRREQSSLVGSGAAADLARSADGLVFGPQVPPATAVETFWAAVDVERRAMSRAVGPRRRLVAAFSTTTLRRRWPA